MISYDFEYYLPSSIKEAVHVFEDLHKQGKDPIYFSGGTEIITLGRLNMVKTGAVIDIKQIPECQMFKLQHDSLITGAANTLTHIEERNLFPLLSKTVSEIADRTARNKITAGGNICGQIFYRESVLPFLLTDSQMVIAGRNGIKTVSILEAFNQRLLLEHGELLVQIKTDQSYLNQPFISMKKRRQWDTGYPLITVAALKVHGMIRIAISGLTSYPFRSTQMEQKLNNRGNSLNQRINEAIHTLQVPHLDDSEGSFPYRLFVLKNTIRDVLHQLEGEE
ncbi:FAD binding domain-containing protein [Niallia endozanthoxylica]|uniref:Xanthine dehydrogenase n=1 Tax=Niallia endozanthoxylica TaxID=2036016 RepID=A0A5J5HQG1_9BACI|nr:FAD binding domain-containing protein [Niallia endozanthoxylica]KAA9024003.1 xanthine dehydrogenase [Niallia endozanthoxylica]